MSKGVVESTKGIKLSWLKSQGYFPAGGGNRGGTLRWSLHGEPIGDIQIRVNTLDPRPSIQLTYKAREHGTRDEAWVSYDYQFPLEKISWRVRDRVVIHQWHIRCQLSKNGVFCGRRVHALYGIGHYFGCIHCANLAYASQNLGGRYKGFISEPDLEEQYMKIKKTHYAGKPTRKYRRFLKMESKFQQQAIMAGLWFGEKPKK